MSAIEARNSNKIIPIKSPCTLQRTCGTLEVWYDGSLTASINVQGMKERKHYMDFHTRQMVNLHKEKYFIWKPTTK
jgi:hypothetical protein